MMRCCLVVGLLLGGCGSEQVFFNPIVADDGAGVAILEHLYRPPSGKGNAFGGGSGRSPEMLAMTIWLGQVNGDRVDAERVLVEARPFRSVFKPGRAPEDDARFFYMRSNGFLLLRYDHTERRLGEYISENIIERIDLDGTITQFPGVYRDHGWAIPSPDGTIVAASGLRPDALYVRPKVGTLANRCDFALHLEFLDASSGDLLFARALPVSLHWSSSCANGAWAEDGSFLVRGTSRDDCLADNDRVTTWSLRRDGAVKVLESPVCLSRPTTSGLELPDGRELPLETDEMPFTLVGSPR